jgi:hypothetical protein
MITLYLIENEDEVNGRYYRSPIVPSIGETIENANCTWVVQKRRFMLGQKEHSDAVVEIWLHCLKLEFPEYESDTESEDVFEDSNFLSDTEE